ncbi:O-antigen ligase family protein [Bacteroides fragilis]
MQDPNKLISFVVAFQVIAQGCKNILVQGFPFFYEINDMLNVVIMGGSLLMYVYALLTTGRLRIPVQTIAVLFFVGMTYLFTYMFSLKRKYIQLTILKTLVTCFFTFLLVSKLSTFEYLCKYFTKGSFLITLSGVLYAEIISVIGHSTTSDWSTYSMTMSNVLLLSVLWQLNAYFDSKNKLALIAAIIGSVVIFIYGSRNPFLAIGFFVSIKILFNSKRKSSSGVAIKLFFVSFVLIVLFFFKEILAFVGGMLDSFGLSSRTLYYLINADTEDITTGRAEIHGKLWDIVLNDPFLGLGVAGDEVAIQELAHSMYLSIFVTYGMILGSLVILYLFSQTIKGICRTSGLNHDIIIMYVCLVFPRSFTGGDIWANDSLWFLMALIISSLRQRKRAMV